MPETSTSSPGAHGGNTTSAGEEVDPVLEGYTVTAEDRANPNAFAESKRALKGFITSFNNKLNSLKAMLN